MLASAPAPTVGTSPSEGSVRARSKRRMPPGGDRSHGFAERPWLARAQAAHDFEL